jgi:hypothetical protein
MVPAPYAQHIGDPEIRITVLKPIKLDLHFIAIEEVKVTEEPPLALDSCDGQR